MFHQSVRSRRACVDSHCDRIGRIDTGEGEREDGWRTYVSPHLVGIRHLVARKGSPPPAMLELDRETRRVLRRYLRDR